MTAEEFIMLHRNDDIKTLALNASKHPDIDFGYALGQIAGWQKAKAKLPEWAATKGIVYPPHLSMEQCSSEKAARYKAEVTKQTITSHKDTGEKVLVDLTGGFGVDFSYMARAFEKAVYVERQENLCDIARHNLEVLGMTNCTVVNADSEKYLEDMQPATLIFVDPARRDRQGGRTFAIADSTPNVLELKEHLLKKSEYVMVKLSPMLDWHKVVSDFGSCVVEVHIVSTANECKELFIVISKHSIKLEKIFCVNDDDIFSFTPDENNLSTSSIKSENPKDNISPELSPNCYLYEPNTSIMKSGCFPLIEQRFGVREIGRNSHLFISDKPISTFPGRHFIITAITSMNRNQLKSTIGKLRSANITVRNFPLKEAELRKRLKLSDGGDTYIFATTTENGKHLLIICKKAI
ncbi:MAG: class I SAM-dependent methyltransferase [Prevotella sp.]|nr:class I SAM-dependent methyltransferase [Prevotella sp.]